MNSQARKFTDFSIRAKLRFLLFSLIATLLFHVSWVVNQNYATWQSMTATTKRMEVAVVTGNLIHQLQIERGRTAGFVQAGGKKFADEIQAARMETNEKLSLLKNLAASQSELQAALAAFDTLDGHRNQISGLALPAGDATGWYSERISTLLKAIASMGNSTGEAEIMRKTTAYVMFMEAKERAGLERALLTSVFTAGHFDVERYARWHKLLSAENSYLAAFAAYGDESAQTKLKALETNQAFKAVDQFRRETQTRMADANLGISADDWFKMATARIDGLHEMENTIAEDIKTITITRSSRAEKILIFTVVVGLAVTFLLSWTSRWIADGVTKMVGSLTDTIHEMARTGDLSKRVPILTHDEAGQAGQAFNNMLDNFQTVLAEANDVMRATGQGVFRPMTAEAQGDFNALKIGINSAVLKLQQTMNALREVMDALAAGNFSKRMDASTEGEIKHAVDRAMEVMQAMLGDVGRVISGVAHGELKRRVTAQGEGDLARLKEDMNRALETLGQTMKAIAGNTQQVASASNQTSNAVGQISDGAQNQMHASDQVASAVRQTAASVHEVARSAEAANARAQQMGRTVNDGMADMNRMVEIVQAISNNAERIDKITEVIEKIANKTNLLSLNAAIEAARAGEHGKGFAVVAEEVGKLAASAAESTQEITALVKQAVGDAERASKTVVVVNKGMQEIAQGARQTEAELQRISAAMEEQSTAVSEINSNVGALNNIASANATAAEEITSTVIELARLADGTRREVEKFSV